MTNQAGQMAERYGYTPYGKRRVVSPGGATLTASAVGNQVGFTGRYHDAETAFTYFRARYMDAELGRFVGRDPVPAVNLYAYATGNPGGRVDPMGMEDCPPTKFGEPAPESGPSDGLFDDFPDPAPFVRPAKSELPPPGPASGSIAGAIADAAKRGEWPGWEAPRPGEVHGAPPSVDDRSMLGASVWRTISDCRRACSVTCPWWNVLCYEGCMLGCVPSTLVWETRQPYGGDRVDPMPLPFPVSRLWRCTATCNVDALGIRVTGSGTGGSEYLACLAAQRDANGQVPSGAGAYKRHCSCRCSR